MAKMCNPAAPGKAAALISAIVQALVLSIFDGKPRVVYSPRSVFWYRAGLDGLIENVTARNVAARDGNHGRTVRAMMKGRRPVTDRRVRVSTTKSSLSRSYR